jgi:hypothetical protein
MTPSWCASCRTMFAGQDSLSLHRTGSRCLAAAEMAEVGLTWDSRRRHWQRTAAIPTAADAISGTIGTTDGLQEVVA